jgi:anaerobic magnesium-protoporphyrin IX monomethyl ester cyclase
VHILLVVPRYSSTWGEFYQVPLGLGYIASAMKRAGHRVSGLNLNHYPGSIEDLVAAKVAEIDPDVCASGALAPFLSTLKAIFAAARKAKPGIVNLAGGGMVSGEPEISLQVMDIDIGVVGEGEVTVAELLNCLEKSGNLQSVKGIVFRDRDGSVVQTPARAQVQDLSQIAWPDYELLECDKNIANQRALDNYFFHSHPESKPRAIDMITSRSCPFSCTFCFHPVGKVYRERPLDDFFAELDSVVARYQVNMVALIDELFSLRKQRLLEFCARIKPYKLQWMVQLHVSSATEEVLSAMHDAGGSYISYGIESMSKPVLESMKKKTKPDRIAVALDMTFERHIGIQGNLLFGDKAETLETANESMHWWAANRRYQVNLTPLMVFPGSPDYYQAIKEGLIVDRAAYVRDIPPNLNISRMNDKNIEMVRFQVWVFANTLLNLAPLKSFTPSNTQVPDRDTTYDIVWDCPRCKHQNDYLGIVLPPDHSHTIRLTCRKCLARWDVENRAYRLPANTINDATCISHLRQAEALFAQERYKDCHDITNELLGLAPYFVPARLLMGRFYRRVGPAEHMLRSFGAALGVAPLDSERHSDFADALAEVGAFGSARMHYQQALALKPRDERASSGISLIDDPQINDRQRATYFVSWSEDPPPRSREGLALAEVSPEMEILSPAPPTATGSPISVFKKLGQWITSQ